HPVLQVGPAHRLPLLARVRQRLAVALVRDPRRAGVLVRGVRVPVHDRLPGADAALDAGAVDDLRAGRLERDAHDRAEDELLGELLGGDGEGRPFEGLVLREGGGGHVVHHGGAAGQPAGGGRQQHRPGEQRPRRRAPGARYRPSCPPPHDPASRPRGRSSSSASEASQSTSSASATVRIEPSISTGLPRPVMPVVISTPRPPPPPKVARVAVPTFSTRAVRTPARISGTASGSSTRVSTPIGDIPMPRAASSRVGSLARRPAMVLASTGSTA